MIAAWLWSRPRIQHRRRYRVSGVKPDRRAVSLAAETGFLLGAAFLVGLGAAAVLKLAVAPLERGLEALGHGATAKLADGGGEVSASVVLGGDALQRAGAHHLHGEIHDALVGREELDIDLLHLGGERFDGALKLVEGEGAPDEADLRRFFSPH